MSDESTSPRLVEFIDEFLRTQDAERLSHQITNHYSEATLTRLLRSSNDVRQRRAAVLALGLTGTFACNDILAEALHDTDASVRQWAEKSMWMVWFRASDDPKHTEQLQAVARSIMHDRPALAVKQATALIQGAPNFAEAYNQRAIAYWKLGMWDESINDCQKVLQLNPCHFGAASGMGQCYLQKNAADRAIECFQQALDINPNLDGVAALLKKLRGE